MRFVSKLKQDGLVTWQLEKAGAFVIPQDFYALSNKYRRRKFNIAIIFSLVMEFGSDE